MAEVLAQSWQQQQIVLGKHPRNLFVFNLAVIPHAHIHRQAGDNALALAPILGILHRSEQIEGNIALQARKQPERPRKILHPRASPHKHDAKLAGFLLPVGLRPERRRAEEVDCRHNHARTPRSVQSLPTRCRFPALQFRKLAAYILRFKLARRLPDGSPIDAEAARHSQVQGLLHALEPQRSQRKLAARRKHQRLRPAKPQPSHQRGQHREAPRKKAVKVKNRLPVNRAKQRPHIQQAAQPRLQIKHIGLANPDPLVRHNAGIRRRLSEVPVQGHNLEIELLAKRCNQILNGYGRLQESCQSRRRVLCAQRHPECAVA